MVDFFLITLATYLLIGALFAIPFIISGIGKIDPTAQKGSWKFRLIVMPGVIAFWPTLFWRWIKGAHRPPQEKNPHRRDAL